MQIPNSYETAKVADIQKNIDAQNQIALELPNKYQVHRQPKTNPEATKILLNYYKDKLKSPVTHAAGQATRTISGQQSYEDIMKKANQPLNKTNYFQQFDVKYAPQRLEDVQNTDYGVKMAQMLGRDQNEQAQNLSFQSNNQIYNNQNFISENYQNIQYKEMPPYNNYKSQQQFSQNIPVQSPNIRKGQQTINQYQNSPYMNFNPIQQQFENNGQSEVLVAKSVKQLEECENAHYKSPDLAQITQTIIQMQSQLSTFILQQNEINQKVQENIQKLGEKLQIIEQKVKQIDENGLKSFQNDVKTSEIGEKKDRNNSKWREKIVQNYQDPEGNNNEEGEQEVKIVPSVPQNVKEIKIIEGQDLEKRDLDQVTSENKQKVMNINKDQKKVEGAKIQASQLVSPIKKPPFAHQNIKQEKNELQQQEMKPQALSFLNDEVQSAKLNDKQIKQQIISEEGSEDDIMALLMKVDEIQKKFK